MGIMTAFNGQSKISESATLYVGCGSTLYVGLAHAVPPTNTNFRLTFLITGLQQALYVDLPV